MVEISILDLLDLDIKENSHLQLKCIAGRSGLSKKIIGSKINRPGLSLSGFYEAFNSDAIQVFGKGEYFYMQKLEKEGTYNTIQTFFSYDVPTCLFTNNLEPSEFFRDRCEENGISILQTPLSSSELTRKLYQLLDEIFATTTTVHAVFVEVYGIGILIKGESGVGKSEAALELIERGHRLISDDIVKLRNIGDTFLVGSGENPDLAHHMEIRGIGIINLRYLYGVGSVRSKKQVQLLVELENWNPENDYNRLGYNEYEEILGIKIPKLIIPVKPGRNIPIILETAAKNERLKIIGFSAADEFDQSILNMLESKSARDLYYNEQETF